MEARFICAVFCAAAVSSLGASYRTQNFIVMAPTHPFAQQVALAAENYRRDLAVEWLGRELPPWQQPCPIRVDVGPEKGAGGATSFAFHGGQPIDWTMSIQGSAERILDSVLPHEVTHTVFATYFGRPLPRWADEGACTTVEHESERQKQHHMLYEFLTTHRGIAFNQMFAMTEYPPDVLPLYAQGYSLARYLIAQGGKRKFVAYVGDGMRWNNWTKATQTHYAFQSLSELQLSWLDWVRRGCPPMPAAPETLLASQQEAPAAQFASLPTRAPYQPEPAEALPSDLEPAAYNAAVTPAAPAPRAAVSGASTSGTGWYARVRDQQVATPPGRVTAVPPPSHSLHDAVGQALARGQSPAPVAQIVTRPQPPQRAQQQVLEWTR